jgi:hypothetical protein
MSAAYKNVLGGSLKLKGKGPAGAPLRRSDAPRPATLDTSSAAPCISGSKRKADVPADSCTQAPPSKRSDHRLDAPTIASPIETKEPESEAGAGKASVDSKPASVADRRTAAQKAHDEALAKRVSGRGASSDCGRCAAIVRMLNAGALLDMQREFTRLSYASPFPARPLGAEG